MSHDWDLTEHEHQALDLLDERPPGSLNPADPTDSAALTVVREIAPRLVGAVARAMLDAASELARTDDRGPLDAGRLDEIRLTLTEHPRLSLAIRPAVETTVELIGLDPDGAATELLRSLGRELRPDPALDACSMAIADRLAAANGDGQISRPLRVFRNAVMTLGGPTIRALTLAFDHPEHFGLARTIVQQHRGDAASLVDAFDMAIAALRAANAEPPADGPPAMDGPKRKFTYVHVILAAIVLGLTLWHYVFR